MFARKRQAGGRAKLLCFGDSNTHGTKAMKTPFDRARYRVATRWTGQLAEKLGGNAKIIEAGQPGRTTVHDDPVEGPHKNGLAVLPAVLETHRPIDAVLLMLGTNDFKARFSMTAPEVARCIERLVRIVEASDSGPEGLAPRTVIISPVPIQETGWLGEMFVGGAEKSRALAARLAETADRLGCGFLDAGAHASVDPADGIHLSKDAHEHLATALAGYVREHLL